MNELTKEIVEGSICNVVCIDDEYISPYEEKPDENKRAFTEKMYNDIGGEKGRNITILKYDTGINDSWGGWLQNKDLLILDWQLDGNETGESALHIIETALERRVPYICLYTNEPQISQMAESIVDYFSFSQKELEEKSDWAKDKGINAADYRDLIESAVSSQHFNKLNERMQDDNIILEENIGNEEWKKILYAWDKKIVVKDDSDKKSTYNFGEGALKVSDTYVFLYNKTTSVGDNSLQPVEINRIISSISETIINKPNSELNVLWVMYGELIKDTLRKDGNYFREVSPEAFFYYSKKLLDDYGKEEMGSFLKNMFIKQVFQNVEAESKPIPEQIVNRIVEEGGRIDKINSETKNDYITLNTLLNINIGQSRNKHYLSFGDVFSSEGGDYFLCVNALCDCAIRKPENQNESAGEENHDVRDYFFISGKEDNRMELFKDVESHHYSFICADNSCGKAIKWDIKTLTSVCFSMDNVMVSKDSPHKVVIHGKEQDIKFVCSISREYAQRMANAAFSNSGRVGVSFANNHK